MFVDLVYCGRVLRDDVSLASCGISSGSSVLALKKRHLVEPSSKPGTQVSWFQKYSYCPIALRI